MKARTEMAHLKFSVALVAYHKLHQLFPLFAPSLAIEVRVSHLDAI